MKRGRSRHAARVEVEKVEAALVSLLSVDAQQQLVLVGSPARHGRVRWVLGLRLLQVPRRAAHGAACEQQRHEEGEGGHDFLGNHVGRLVACAFSAWIDLSVLVRGCELVLVVML